MILADTKALERIADSMERIESMVQTYLFTVRPGPAPSISCHPNKHEWIEVRSAEDTIVRTYCSFCNMEKVL